MDAPSPFLAPFCCGYYTGYARGTQMAAEAASEGLDETLRSLVETFKRRPEGASGNPFDNEREAMRPCSPERPAEVPLPATDEVHRPRDRVRKRNHRRLGFPVRARPQHAPPKPPLPVSKAAEAAAEAAAEEEPKKPALRLPAMLRPMERELKEAMSEGRYNIVRRRLLRKACKEAGMTMPGESVGMRRGILRRFLTLFPGSLASLRTKDGSQARSLKCVDVATSQAMDAFFRRIGGDVVPKGDEEWFGRKKDATETLRGFLQHCARVVDPSFNVTREETDALVFKTSERPWGKFIVLPPEQCALTKRLGYDLRRCMGVNGSHASRANIRLAEVRSEPGGSSTSVSLSQ